MNNVPNALHRINIPTGDALRLAIGLILTVVAPGAMAEGSKLNLSGTLNTATNGMNTATNGMNTATNGMKNARFKEASAYDEYIAQRVPVLRAYYEGRGYRVTEDVLQQAARKELSDAVIAHGDR